MSLTKSSPEYHRHMDEVFMDQQLFVDPYYDGYDEWLYFQQREKQQPTTPKTEDHVDSKQQRKEDL